MYQSKKLLTLAVAIVSLLSVTHVNANETNKYWGLGLGNASWDLKPFVGTFELDDGTALRGFMGRRSGNTGFEGEIAVSSHDWPGSGGLASHTAVHFIFSAIGFHQMSSAAELYGKAGLNLWSTTVDFIGVSYEGDSGVNIALAGGVDFTVSEKTHIRAEYQILPGLGYGVDEGDINQFTVNGVFSY